MYDTEIILQIMFKLAFNVCYACICARLRF